MIRLPSLFTGKMRQLLLTLAISIVCSLALQAQRPQPPLVSLRPADTLHKPRLYLASGSGVAIYGAVATGLWNSWYKDYPLGPFHTFNDMGEWRGMDKAGHFFSTWMEANYAFQGARWTGMSRKQARWTAVGVGLGIQTTIEIMDGFSEQWGFSWYDMAFNFMGASLFFTQELAWGEQRIRLKASGHRPRYPRQPIADLTGAHFTTLDDRAAELYGTSPFQVILKDYNGLTVWASFNLAAFSKKRRLPPWLNLAVGYGAGNIYGGFGNEWTTDEGATFRLDPERYPRYSQFYLAPDIDLSRIPTRHRWLRFTLGMLNWLKFPAPTFEVNTLGQTRFHWIYW